MLFFISFSASTGFVFSYLAAAALPRWQYNFALSAALLLFLAFGLVIASCKASPYLKKDEAPVSANENKEQTIRGKRMIMLFLSSGFLISLPTAFFRYMVDNSTKTFSPTMLSQSYEQISTSIGSLLTILVVVAGIFGTLIVRFLLYPRLFKNEFTCTLALLTAALPFTILLRFVGTIPAWLCILSLCMMALLLTGTSYLASCFAARFVKFRLNGTAAGILNSSYSLALVFQYTLFGNIAQKVGWTTVTTVWIMLIALSAILIAFAIRPSIRFKREIN